MPQSSEPVRLLAPANGLALDRSFGRDCEWAREAPEPRVHPQRTSSLACDRNRLKVGRFRLTARGLMDLLLKQRSWHQRKSVCRSANWESWKYPLSATVAWD